MLKVGVLALQGSVEEHVCSFQKIKGVSVCKIKETDELDNIDGLVLPGGESTTIGKLLRGFKLLKPIVSRINKGMPVWGTCAGMILMVKNIVGEEQTHLGVMDITVRRNAYGSQLDSFSTTMCIPAVSTDEIPLIFIRAPWVESVRENVRVLANVNGKIVAVQQKHMLATAFHPELTDDISFHKYFAEMVGKRNKIVF
jgi:5'-phosphate synthase pdxT subunit